MFAIVIRKEDGKEGEGEMVVEVEEVHHTGVLVRHVARRAAHTHTHTHTHTPLAASHP